MIEISITRETLSSDSLHPPGKEIFDSLRETHLSNDDFLGKILTSQLEYTYVCITE